MNLAMVTRTIQSIGYAVTKRLTAYAFTRLSHSTSSGVAGCMKEGAFTMGYTKEINGRIETPEKNLIRINGHIHPAHISLRWVNCMHNAAAANVCECSSTA